VSVEGFGLHTGTPTIVHLEPCDGPVRVCGAIGTASGARAARIDELVPVSTKRSTTVEAGGGALRLASVEHLFAALGGLGIFEGISIHVNGEELPLLDGAARVWCDALDRVGPHVAGRRRLRVVQRATVECGDNRYEFSPDDRVRVEVELDFPGTPIEPRAQWTGDPDDFRARIASARTFALVSEVSYLADQGLARHIAPTSIVLIGPNVAYCTGGPFAPDEPARHKLLDLVGDSYLFGGPPLGRVLAVRPGHTSNIEAFRRALAAGVIARPN
jgi:UDP-3-O-[3-hydroxymyristoyl] N-acetylglucosamine deacetylase